MELLFESRDNLSNFSGPLHFVQCQPKIHQEAVLRPDTFVDGGGISSYGTVLRDGGRLRMWHQSTPTDWPGDVDVAAVAYAESEDGYEWKKVPLGLVPHGTIPNHLCDLGLHSPSIFIDPNSPPSHRYRATGSANEGLFLVRPGLRTGYYTAHSADGLRWELDTPEPRWEDSDVITSIYHPGRQGGVVALKKRPYVNRLRRRTIHTAIFKDGAYTDHVSALYPDEYDDIAAIQRGHRSSDYYSMAMMPAGEGTVGFICNFRHDLPYGERPYGMIGNSDVTLAFQQREGDRWLHAPSRPDFISHTDLPWTSGGWIGTTSTPVEMGDEHWLYFAGRNFEHGAKSDPPEKFQSWRQQHATSGMTFARWPKYRLFGFETPRQASFTIQIRNATEPFQLSLNYKTRPGGSVSASFARDDRYSLENALPLSGDQLKFPLAWRHGTTIFPPENGRVNLTIHLNQAAVYAYDVTPVT